MVDPDSPDVRFLVEKTRRRLRVPVWTFSILPHPNHLSRGGNPCLISWKPSNEQSRPCEISRRWKAFCRSSLRRHVGTQKNNRPHQRPEKGSRRAGQETPARMEPPPSISTPPPRGDENPMTTARTRKSKSSAPHRRRPPPLPGRHEASVRSLLEPASNSRKVGDAKIRRPRQSPRAPRPHRRARFDILFRGLCIDCLFNGIERPAVILDRAATPSVLCRRLPRSQRNPRPPRTIGGCVAMGNHAMQVGMELGLARGLGPAPEIRNLAPPQTLQRRHRLLLPQDLNPGPRRGS